MAKEKVIDMREIISTHQLISILSYNQYMLAIEKKVKNQAQIFKVEATNYESRKIGITNLYIPAKSPKHIKISIYNTMEKIIEIPKDFTSPRSPTRQQEPLQTSSNLLDFLAENRSEHFETAVNEENDSEISEEESIDSENEEDEMTAYIAKIFEFNREDIKTSPQKWLNQVTKAGDANGWNAARMLRTISYFLKRTAGEWFENLTTPFNDWTAFKTVFLEQFTDNNTSITLRNCFHNIKQEPSESVMTYIGKFNKLLRQICQLKTNDYYSDAQILDQFIAGLKNKLIKKHAKRYEMAMKEANRTKLVNLAIGETSSAAEKKIDQLAKKVKNYFTNQQQQQPQRYQPSQRRNQNNFTLPSNNQSQSCHYYGIFGHWKKDCRKLQQNQQNRSNQHYLPPQQSYYQLPPLAYHPPRPQYQTIPTTTHTTLSGACLKINSAKSIYTTKPIPTQPRPTHYHTQPSYLTISEEQDFYHTALSEARIAENANLSDIFFFKFEANESLFLLSNAAANEQKAIMAMYTEAEVEEKTIRLILDNRFAGSIITYQLMQQLKRNVDQPAQTVIVTADGMKKTPVREIDNFLFILDGIIILVKVLVMDTLQYQALVENNWLQKANAKLDWETQELQLSYQGQHTRVPTTCGTFNKCSEKAPAFEFEPKEEKPIIKTFMALGSMSNWADKTEQEHFTPYSKPETSG
ncbi:hypothetical protein G9A89_006703 [Geosiphon pyriformis]|nr:hypothetical protein G9A89_006703 [Geosiphon pyriformis]